MADKTLYERCPWCDGKGTDDDSARPCPVCKGEKYARYGPTAEQIDRLESGARELMGHADRLQRERDATLECLHLYRRALADAIRRPMGVVPDSAVEAEMRFRELGEEKSDA